MSDLKDTIRRMRHVGRLVNLTEDSEYIKLTDILMTLDRERLEDAIKSTKRTLSDWAGKDLDNFWGTILSLRRIEGVDSVDDFLDDPTYVERLQKFMRAANQGSSLESTRLAAEAGSGASFKITSSARGIVLRPLEELSPAQREGAMRTARRIAPASSIVEFAQSESLESFKPSSTWSDSVYVGPPPGDVMGGPQFDSENLVRGLIGTKWSEAPEGSFGPTNGLPSNLMREGIWHVSSMGFGETHSLEITTNTKLLNRIRFSVGPGDWYIEFFDKEELIKTESVNNETWEVIEVTFPFISTGNMKISLKNPSQDFQDLYLKGLYVGARVTEENRLEWLSKGGETGEAEEDIIVADGGAVNQGGEWISIPRSSPSDEDSFYATLSGSPVKVAALYMQTSREGCRFTIYHSNDYVYEEEEYPNIRWTRLPGVYEMTNGRIDVHEFRARQVKLVITNLQPTLLREFHNAE